MNPRIVAFALALLLAAPLATAAWKGRGFFEPDTPYDVADGYLWLEPDTDPDANVRKVYFSAFSSYYLTGVNVNSATTGSRLLAAPVDVQAMLGVWKDCNQDGYVGLIEGALAEYPVALLPSTAICPVSSSVPAHNDGKWVRELLVIGPDFLGPNGPQNPAPVNNTNPWNIADESARIWVDWGRPEERTYGTCLALPGSRGHTQSTGGALRYADCLAGWRVTSTINLVGSQTGLHNIRFDDAPRERPDQSGSILNRPNPYGQPDAAPLVSVYDCSRGPMPVRDPTAPAEGGQGSLSRVEDPTGGQLSGPIGAPGNLTVTVFSADDKDWDIDSDGTFLMLNQLRPVPTVDPNGSPAGTVSETLEGAGSNCDRSEGFGNNSNLYDIVENDQEASPAARTGTDMWFDYNEGGDDACRRSTTVAGNPVAVPDCGPASLGLQQTVGPKGGLVVTGRPQNAWTSLPGFVASRNPYVNRDSMEPWGAVWATAYATVNTQAIEARVLATVTGTYGSDHCNGTQATTGWFNCDPERWYRGPAGSDIKSPWQVRVGQSYNLRDIDCYDQSAFQGSPVTTSLLEPSRVCA